MAKDLIVITGASSGIGLATAKLFSEKGYSLGLLARNIEPLKSLNLPNSQCHSVDVADNKSLKKAIKSLENELGSVDCLINNAGLSKEGDFVDIGHDENERMIQTNFIGVLNTIEIVLPNMRKRKSGSIINISSVADRNARPKLATYAATKAAVKSLSESLRMANANYGIRICHIAPAKVLTPMLKSINMIDHNVISAEEIAQAILWVYQQPQTICIRDLVIAPTSYEP